MPVEHYIFNLVGDDAAERAARRLRVAMWAVDAEEPERDALAEGDLVLLYLGAPAWTIIGRAAVASPVRDWTRSEARAYPESAPSGVLLERLEEWDPPVPMSDVLARIDRSAGARADFDTGVVRITAGEYATALAEAGRAASSG